MADVLSALAPHKSSFGLNKPRSLSNNMSLSKPVVSTMANWMSYLDVPDPIKLEKMRRLLVD